MQGKETVFHHSEISLKLELLILLERDLKYSSQDTKTITIRVLEVFIYGCGLNYSHPLLDDPLQPWFSSVFLIQQGLRDAAWSESCYSYENNRM